MKESDLRRLLPDGIADFNDWHAQISKYNTPLMRHLDSLDIPEKKENWTRTALYEIVLWELDRFPGIDDALFMDLGKAAEIPPEDFRKVKETLCRLLACNHVGMTMATAILRFINPETFQTMNRRNAHVVMPAAMFPEPPSKPGRDYYDTACEFYFKYLAELRKLSCDGFEFRIMDRRLYQIDKASGRKLE